MAITLVSSVGANPGQHGGASGAITTTGAVLLVLSVGWYAGAGTEDVTVSDSKGNTWTPLTKHTGLTGRHRFWYTFSPTVGTGHTFTVSGSNTYPALIAYAFAGVTSYQTQSGNGHASTSPVASGSVTPTTDGALLLTAIGANEAATDSLSPGGFTATTVPSVASVSVQNTSAYLVQSAITAVNPTWSWTGTHSGIAVSTAVFLPVPPAPLVAVAALLPLTFNGVTSGPIDTSGATLLVVSVCYFATATVSDSKGNTWIGLTTHTAGGAGGQHRFWYCLSPTVGTGHTFTVSGFNIYAPATVHAFSGTWSYQTESGGGSASSTGPIASGSVTPTADGALILTALGSGGTTTAVEAVSPAGFWAVFVPGQVAISLQLSTAHLVQTPAAAINPTWAWSAGTRSDLGVSTAVFGLPAAERVQSYVWMPV